MKGMKNMPKTIVTEGRTTNEAIEKGLKELNLSKDKVEVKVLENEEKRSFFSILAPRVVKVELTVKENVEKNEKEQNVKTQERVKKDLYITKEQQEKAKQNIEIFLNDFLQKLKEQPIYEIEANETGLNVTLKNENLGYLIGYRGETLYSLQNILTSIAGKGIDGRVRVILDIEGYKEKREKTLEDLAEKVAKTVIKTKKSITLEPMQAYERKIIHSKLQGNSKIETKSIGEEPRRRIVISLKK